MKKKEALTFGLPDQQFTKPMIGSSTSVMESSVDAPQRESKKEKPQKPPFRRAQDDTKPPLHDPILRSDPIETEEAVLRLPPLPSVESRFRSR